MPGHCAIAMANVSGTDRRALCRDRCGAAQLSWRSCSACPLNSPCPTSSMTGNRQAHAATVGLGLPVEILPPPESRARSRSITTMCRRRGSAIRSIGPVTFLNLQVVDPTFGPRSFDRRAATRLCLWSRCRAGSRFRGGLDQRWLPGHASVGSRRDRQEVQAGMIMALSQLLQRLQHETTQFSIRTYANDSHLF